MSSENNQTADIPYNEDSSSGEAGSSTTISSVGQAPGETRVSAKLSAVKALLADTFDEAQLDDGKPVFKPTVHERIGDPDENGFLVEDEIGEIVALARESNITGQSHTGLMGLDAGTQCAILWKSLMNYLQNNPSDYSQLGSWPSKIVKAIPNSLKNDAAAMDQIKIISVSSFYNWKTYASNITANIKRFGCSYNLAGKDVFVKTANYMVGENVIIDVTYFPYYVPYEVTVKGGGVVPYNAMPKFVDATGKKFTPELVLLYLYSYALLFKCHDKNYSLEPFIYNGSIGNTPNPSFVVPAAKIVAAFKQWKPPAGATIVGAFHHFITWSLSASIDATTMKSGPLYPLTESGVWAAKELYEIAAQYPVSPKVLSTAYISPAALLDTMRKVRDCTILDQGWSKDSDQGGFTKIIAGPDADKYCINRTVINKCLRPLQMIVELKPDYVLYGGVAGNGNYQAAYMQGVLDKHSIPMITFDKVSRVNTHRVDATDVDDVMALFSAVKPNSTVIVYCDIDFAGQNDNKKPVQIINVFYEACPKGIDLLAVFHKATLLAPIPLTQSVDIGVKFVRHQNSDYVIGRKHNAEGVLVGIRGLPHAVAASVVDPRLYAHSSMGPPALRWLEKFSRANVFRGMDVPLGRTTDGTKLVQFSALPPRQCVLSDECLEFCPVPEVRVKVKSANDFQITDELSEVAPRLEVVRSRNILRALIPSSMSDHAVARFVEAMHENYALDLAVTKDVNVLECSTKMGNDLSVGFIRATPDARE